MRERTKEDMLDYEYDNHVRRNHVPLYTIF